MDNKIQNVAFDNDGKLEGTIECNTTQDIKIEEKRYCRKCKQWLPVSYFEKYGIGIRHVCKACQHNIKNPSEKFIDFTSRELIEELRRRGYRGKLTYTEVTEVKL